MIKNAIIDKNVIIDENVVIGDFENIPNKERPDLLDTGITVIGKGTKIKKGMHIGQNVRIFGNIDFNELSLTKVDSGETITKGVK